MGWVRLDDRGVAGALGALALPLGVGALFWGRSFASARGYFPAPLDDVYIHFDFARSLAQGHPFEWIPGNGYSSGETAPLYAALLAVGWLVGMRGPYLGAWGGFVAIASLALLVRAIRRLARPAPAWLGWGVAALPFSLPVVDWTLFSGMEVASFAGAFGQTLLAVERARGSASSRRGKTRETWQWIVSAWCAVLVLLRPEASVLVFVIAVAMGRSAGPRSAVLAMGRTLCAPIVVASALLAANAWATGDMRAAGAQLKLLSSNPFLSDVDRARTLVENLVTFFVKVVRAEVAWVAFLLAVASLFCSSRKTLAACSTFGALLWILLASWNGNAPYHNFRYYAPPLLLLSTAAALGIAGIARHGPWGRRVAALVLAWALLVGATRFPVQTSHFRRAVANIRDQHVEVAMRLANLTPEGARVLVGDAGVIPYLSGRGAIDALGLGGYRTLPFARAAVHGEPAMLELIERLAPASRPTHLALYPNWFSATTSRFGIEIDRVTIVDNVICGGPTKGIYRADWAGLDEPHDEPHDERAVDEIDVADIVSEAEHGYVAPSPEGGFTTLDLLEDERGTRRFDGGRIVPEGRVESFVVRHVPAGQRARIRVRVDRDAGELSLRVRDATTALALEDVRNGAWRSGVATVRGLAQGDTVVLEARRGAYRNYHVWVEADD